MNQNRVFRPVVGTVLLLTAAVLVYLMIWPVPIDPVAWDAPESQGYTGDFAINDGLDAMEAIDISPYAGPEDIAIDLAGNLYTGTEEGEILRIGADRSVSTFATTGGRPLGMEFDADGNLLVANGELGLQQVSADGVVSLLADTVDGERIAYADDLDIAPDGRIYFSDASTKFGSTEFGGGYEASLLDIMEHGGHGRLLVYDPASGKTSVVLDGLQFANGVAADPEGRFLLVNETGSYRVLKHWLAGPSAGTTEVLIDNLPGFPDNVNRGLDGRYWIGLVGPRNDPLDALSDKPFLRKVVQRLPAAMRPQAVPSAHVIAIDETGSVVANLHGHGTPVTTLTGVLETPDALYLSSLISAAVGVRKKD